jgi:hypothetical protein
LNLPGPAAAAWEDVVKRRRGGVERVARSIDDDRVAFRTVPGGTKRRSERWQESRIMLKEVDDLAAENGKSGTARRTRIENQSKIDKLMKEIQTTAR